ncbi:hypothetical protein R3P38DRAFT_2543115 [Favolaschia claudopus]|uniref:Uncharacterized protein n=1 Tax=Favolaschia claudopus TaxID=2862362 RepID=A0AAW0ASQ9_9AGAR
MPLLTEAHQRKQKAWAEVHYYWTEKDWRAVIFSDRSKFGRMGENGAGGSWSRPATLAMPERTSHRAAGV